MIRSLLCILCVFCTVVSAENFQYNDAHLHITNFRQQGIDLKTALKLMNDEHIYRAAVFGIPLQRYWRKQQARFYYYSAVDANTARAFLALPYKDQARFDPMIVGFNPVSNYAVAHIKRMLTLYPGVFSGIGEFSVQKEIIFNRLDGPKPTFNEAGLNHLLSFASQVGMVAIIHADIDSIAGAKDQSSEAIYFNNIKSMFMRHPNLTIIWAHSGLGQYIIAKPNHTALLFELLDVCPNVYIDLSWDAVAKQITKNKASLKAWAHVIKQFPDRFLVCYRCGSTNFVFL